MTDMGWLTILNDWFLYNIITVLIFFIDANSNSNTKVWSAVCKNL